MPDQQEEVAQCNSELPRVYQLNLNIKEAAFLGGILLMREASLRGDLAEGVLLARLSAIQLQASPTVLDDILTRLNELLK